MKRNVVRPGKVQQDLARPGTAGPGEAGRGPAGLGPARPGMAGGAAGERPAKGRRTPKRNEALAAQRERAQAMRSWLQDRLAAWQEKRKNQPAETPAPRTGVTAQMRNIRWPAPQWVHQHTGPNNRQRRHFPRPDGGTGTWPKELRQPAVNVPYVNPARDLKRSRAKHLRRDR